MLASVKELFTPRKNGIMVEACKEDENLEGQMEIEDYPEYLPDDFKEK